MCSLRRSGEARLFGQESFHKLSKCEIGEANVNSDNILTIITNLVYLKTQQHRTSRIHEQCISLSTTIS